VSHDELVLEAADGNRFAAFGASPEQATGVGVVILPDVRGLYRFYRDLAFRFAERGIHAVAIDYFGRTAGVANRDDAFEYQPHVTQTTTAGVQLDAAAAVAWLRSAAGGSCDSVFTVGFCFGGRNSWLASGGGHGLAGAVGFYGRPGQGRDGSDGPTQLAATFEAPILGLMGGADEAIPPDDVRAFAAALKEAGVEHELHVYDGAPHSFFDRSHEENAQASADAWQRVLDFIARFSRATTSA
jgi:carboxymethylenebutenolidase